MVYCATRNAVFRFDSGTNETARINKTNALNDVDVSALGWSGDLNALVGAMAMAMWTWSPGNPV